MRGTWPAAAVAGILAALAPRPAIGQAPDAGPPDAAPAAPRAAAPPAPPDAAPPVPPDAAPAPPEPDWAAAPLPTEASGVATPADSGAQWPRSLGRALLFVPKWVFIAVASPVRLAAWSYERFQLRDRFEQVFFNVDGTFGVFPVAFFETGFGLNVGARLIHKDLFGDGESVRLRAGFGGLYEQVYELELGTGDRLGSRFSLKASGRLERRDKDKFYGIGNTELDAEPGMQLDAQSGAAVESRFRQDVTRAILTGDLRVAGDLSIRVSGALMFRDFDGHEGAAEDQENIVDNYDPATLVGFEQGTSSTYGEIELRYDSRRRASVLQTRAIHAAGLLASVFGGYQSGLGDDPSDFLRYGADVQAFFDLYNGSRVLAVRAYVEGIAFTDGRIDGVPFVDLPRLGGSRLLRGYDLDRFRDRVVTLATIEYSYDVGLWAHGFLFVDAGRAFRDERDIDVDLDEYRIGYGAGLQLHTGQSLLSRVHLATSIDGGLFVNLSFDPAFKPRERAGRL